MLKITINTKYLKYKNQQLDELCRQGDAAIAACVFVPNEKKPVCNVPLECFDSRFFDITAKQSVYFARAMQVVKLYFSTEQDCLYYHLPQIIIELIFKQMFGFAGDISEYCNPDYQISMIPDPLAIEHIPDKDIQVEVIGNLPGGLLQLE